MYNILYLICVAPLMLSNLTQDQSIVEKILVHTDSKYRDNPTETDSNSIKFTFADPIERAVKVDINGASIPSAFYNVQRDCATLLVKTTTASDETTTPLILDDTKPLTTTIPTTAEAPGTLAWRTKVSAVDGNISGSTACSDSSGIYLLCGASSATYPINFYDTNTPPEILPNVSSNSGTSIIAKYDTNGVLLWRFVVMYSGGGGILVSDSTGIYVITGGSPPSVDIYDRQNTVSPVKTISISTGIATVIIKYDTEGTFLWGMYMTAPGYFLANNAYPIPNGGGICLSSIVYGNDAYFYDTNGTIISDKTISTLINFSYRSGIVVSFDVNGSILWRTVIISGSDTYAYSCAADESGIYVSGSAIGSGNVLQFSDAKNILSVVPSKDMVASGTTCNFLAKYDMNGDIQWRTKQDGVFEGTSNLAAEGGNIYLSVGAQAGTASDFYDTSDSPGPNILPGQTISSWTFYYSCIAKYDANGVLIWRLKLDSGAPIIPKCLYLAENTIFPILGMSADVYFSDTSDVNIPSKVLPSIGSSGLTLATYNFDGDIQWRTKIEAFGGQLTASSSTISRPFGNKIYVAGWGQRTPVGQIQYYNTADTPSIISIVQITAFRDTFLASYIADISNFEIMASPMDSGLVIRKTLTGFDTKYTIKLNCLSDQLGFNEGTAFEPIVLGADLGSSFTVANPLSVSAANDQLILRFRRPQGTAGLFVSVDVKINIPPSKYTDYTPYNLANSLSQLIVAALSLPNSGVPYSQSFSPVIFSESKNIFYIRFALDGTFTVLFTSLALDMKLTTDTEAPVYAIADEERQLADIMLSDLSKIIMRTTDGKSQTEPTTILVPPGTYDIASLITNINNQVVAINGAFSPVPFSYDAKTGKVSFQSIFTGSDILVQTALLIKMGFSVVPGFILSGEILIAENVAEIAATRNLYIKSRTISNLRRTKIPFTNNERHKDVIAKFRVADGKVEQPSLPIEIYLNQKETISTVDFTLLDDDANVVNLNGADWDTTMYYYVT